MQTVVDVKTMRESDAAAIRGGVDGRALMYRAGEGILRAYPFKGKTAIVCGSGNNAGDGYVLALLLQQAAVPCAILLVEERFSEDGLFTIRNASVAGSRSCPLTERPIFRPMRRSWIAFSERAFGGSFPRAMPPRSHASTKADAP